MAYPSVRCVRGVALGSGMSPWGRVVPSARARCRALVTSRADGAVAGDGRVRLGRRRERWDGTMSDSGEQNYGERVIHGARARCAAGPPPTSRPKQPSIAFGWRRRPHVPPCPLSRVAEPLRERRGGRGGAAGPWRRGRSPREGPAPSWAGTARAREGQNGGPEPSGTPRPLSHPCGRGILLLSSLQSRLAIHSRVAL